MNTSLLFSSFPFIVGEKVSLARISELDLRDLWAVVGDEESYRMMPTAAVSSFGEAGGKLRQAESLFRDKRAVVLGIYPNDQERRLVGTLSVQDIDPQVEAVSLSFIVGPRDRERGYAAGAVRAAADYLMKTVGVQRIQAAVLPVNYRATLVLERCGFQKEGTLREAFFWPDKGVVDLTVYSLLPSDRRPKTQAQHLF